MRATAISLITLALLLGLVIFFSLYTGAILKSGKEMLAAYDFSTADYALIAEDLTNIREKFVKQEPMLRLIISDNSLLEVDYLFSDVIEYARAENREGVMASAGRLSVILEHLLNQSSLNLISIF